jgi:hypothetical protein
MGATGNRLVAPGRKCQVRPDWPGPECPLTVTPRPDRDALEVTLQLASVIVVKMSTDPLSIYWPPGSSDFVDISDVFLDAAEGMSLLRVKLIDIVMIYA